jgi:dTDP-glucose 4,6-dehydratase
VRVARIFNTYGPRMRLDDGRAVPTFVSQALADERLTVHGNGEQTRSLCYVDDLIEGLLALFTAQITGPVNVGNPSEVTMTQLAEAVIEAAGSSSDVGFVPRPVDDPEVRRPDTTLAEAELGWRAQIDLATGLARTIEWARRVGAPTTTGAEADDPADGLS